MAYNVLKGNIGGAVSTDADEEIGGVKIFKNTISASVFYDTDAESPCATMKDVAFKKLSGGSKNALVTYQGDDTAKAEYNLTFDGEFLSTKNVRAESFVGSATGLTNLPVDQFNAKVPAHTLNLGSTVVNVRGKLQVKGNNGIESSDEGLCVRAHSHGALGFNNKQLTVDPTRCQDVTAHGQNLSDNDVILVHDSSRGDTRKTTLTNFYSSYINSKIPHPAGSTHSIQFKGTTGLGGSPRLTFNPASNVLNVDGTMVAAVMMVSEKTTFEGAVHHQGAVFNNITTVSSENYEVAPDDYTILCDTTKNSTTILLPVASECKGRVLIIKKINVDTYNLRSYPLTIEVDEGGLDYHKKVTLKTTYSSRTFQSDGDRWWIINKTGT